MKAIVYEKYGSPDVLQLKEVAEPAPTADEVLIKVHAVSLNGSDREGLVGSPFYVRLAGLWRPGHPILGSDVAGRVEKVGKNISQFQPGDEVFGEIPNYHGGLAEYACAPERTLARKPASLSFEQAAAIPQAGAIALRAIRNTGQVQPGQSVLVNGAGGGAGSFAVQLAKHYGAEVTAVDHLAKLDFLRSLGADHVIDYTRKDFTKTGKQYDLILDVIAHRPAFAYPRALKPNGTCFFVGGSVATALQILLLGSWIKRRTGKSLRLLFVPQNAVDLITITELCETGIVSPKIDTVYPFRETQEAFRHMINGHARGKIVVTLESDHKSS